LIELPLLTDVCSEQPINVIGDEAITISINGNASLETSTNDNLVLKHMYQVILYFVSLLMYRHIHYYNMLMKTVVILFNLD
jgi:hypothetical protein